MPGMTEKGNLMSDKKEKFSAIKGMNDLLPADAPLWDLFENTAESVLKSYGYQKIVTPIVEETGLFARAIGAVTDIVEKEMYAFEDRADKHGQAEHLALRPEMTAGVVRAVTEHSFLRDAPRRLYYFGPMFRREKPQKGRYRQFHQMGVEALGFAGPDVDAEVILMGSRLLRELGLRAGEHVRLELNCLGDLAERRAHREALIAHLEQHKALLDEDSQRRLYTNPLRVLDTKNPALQDMANAAPKLLDFLGEASLAHFNGVRAILDSVGIAYTINPRLVHKELYTGKDMATANPAPGAWSANPFPSTITLYKPGAGWPTDFDQKKADDYYKKCVAKVGGLVKDTVAKWKAAGFK